MAAVRRGERAAVFAFEESYRTAAERALGLGMDIDAAIEARLLCWEQVNPAALSPGEFVDVVKSQVQNGGEGARLIVIDSLNSYIASMPEEQALTLHLHELLAYLGNQGVTTILVMAQHGMVGDTQAPLDVSFLADTIILLRYFEADGHVRKAISVLKNRSGWHETTIREYHLDGGMSVGRLIKDFQGVLTGLPRISAPPMLLRNPKVAGVNHADLRGLDERVLILAPARRDAPTVAEILEHAGFIPKICDDLTTLCHAFEQEGQARR